MQIKLLLYGLLVLFFGGGEKLSAMHKAEWQTNTSKLLLAAAGVVGGSLKLPRKSVFNQIPKEITLGTAVPRLDCLSLSYSNRTVLIRKDIAREFDVLEVMLKYSCDGSMKPGNMPCSIFDFVTLMIFLNSTKTPSLQEIPLLFVTADFLGYKNKKIMSELAEWCMYDDHLSHIASKYLPSIASLAAKDIKRCIKGIKIDLSNKKLYSLNGLWKLAMLCEDPKEITEIDLSKNHIFSVGPELLNHFPNARIINFSHNNLMLLKKGCFSGLQDESFIDLSNNAITTIEEGAFKRFLRGAIDLNENRLCEDYIEKLQKLFFYPYKAWFGVQLARAFLVVAVTVSVTGAISEMTVRHIVDCDDDTASVRPLCFTMLSIGEALGLGLSCAAYPAFFELPLIESDFTLIKAQSQKRTK